MKYGFILGLPLFALTAQAFIPPLPAVIKELFDKKKTVLTGEWILRHRVALPKSDDTMELEERCLKDKSKVLCVWKGGGSTVVTSLSSDRKQHHLGKEKSLPVRSALFRAYLFSNSPDEFLGRALAEHFIRKDQLLQFKAGFSPEGDPKTWPIKENYFFHNDISLKRLANGVGISVEGVNEPGMARILFFDKELRGILRIEWKDGEMVNAWNFSQFSSIGSLGVIPKKMTFESQAAVQIQSELLSWKGVSEKQAAEFRRLWQGSSHTQPSRSMEATIAQALSYR